MDRLEGMRLFVRVAELGSFSAVAQQLGAARSVVTRQIAALETHLGAKLLARSTRRLSLTSAGAAYLEKCRVILNLVDVAESGVAEERQTPRGLIRMSLPLLYSQKYLAPLLIEFSRRHPEVTLDMDFSDRRAKLIEEGIDLAVRITATLEPGDVVRKLGSGRMVVVASPDYLARHGAPQHPAELINHQCLGYTASASGARWAFVVDGRLRVEQRLAQLREQTAQWATRKDDAEAEIERLAELAALGEEQTELLAAQVEEQALQLPDLEDSRRAR